MSTSIGKISKSFFLKLLVGIIILPFVFWGMGDVFRGGNQNVVASIESEKISTQEIQRHINRLNLDKTQIQNLKNSDLFEKILADYIGRKVMSLEIESLGIKINDSSLRRIIKNDKLFSKDKKFSRTEYEKFLLKSGTTAPEFEKNIVRQESRRQMLSSLSGGITIPEQLVINSFNKENQNKIIKYLDINNLESNKVSQSEINEFFEKNKSVFIEQNKSIQYAEIIPQIVSTNDYDESFFKELDTIENKILDGQSFEESIAEYGLKVISINNVNINKKDNFDKIKNISDKLFSEIYKIEKEKTPKVLEINNKYYLAEVKSIEQRTLQINNKKVQKAIKTQLKFQKKLKTNTKILKEISLGGFDDSKMQELARQNNLIIKDYKISSIEQNDIFSKGIIKRIFQTNDEKIEIITNNDLTKNYLIQSIKTEYKKIDKSSNVFEQYEAKARLDLINKIYKIFDDSLNNKYKVEINKRTIDRIKNSF